MPNSVIPAASSETVYFAHAWEDKAIARPVAEYLMAEGIETWFDEWEMQGGDSLRQKMDQGLGACTHFVVLLTRTSLTKPWVNAEIDSGFEKRMAGTARFVPIRFDLSVTALPPLMRGIMAREIDPALPDTLQQLASDIRGVSSRPPLGRPRYVHRADAHPHYAASAQAVAKAMVELSKAAEGHDPQVDRATLVRETGLSEDDVEIGTHDLVQAGLAEASKTIGSTVVWPLGPMFVTFDPLFMGWSPIEDARALAAHMVNGGKEQWDTTELQKLAGWPDRRMNAALAAVEAGKLARTRSNLTSGLIFGGLVVTTETKRAARDA